MNVAAWIVGVVLMAVFTMAGGMKVVDAGPVPQARRSLGYTKRQYQLIGSAELAAVVGMVVGLIWRSLEFVAVAAAVGLVAMMLGALMAHARAEDETKDIIPAAAMFVLSIVFIIFISLR